MATNDFECGLYFDDIDLARPDLWRPRMIDMVNDETFASVMSDLVTTGTDMATRPVAREFGGSCSVRADVDRDGHVSGSVSCGFTF